MNPRTIVNSLTFSRIIFSLIFAYVILFYNSNLSYLSLIFLLIMFSDYFDGKLARRLNVASDKGGIFDVLTDFFFIMISSISLAIVGLLPFWIILFIIIKMIEFFKTSKKSSSNLYYDKFGHLVSLMFYALPIFTVIFYSLMPISVFYILINIICLIIAISAVISTYLRIKFIKNS